MCLKTIFELYLDVDCMVPFCVQLETQDESYFEVTALRFDVDLYARTGLSAGEAWGVYHHPDQDMPHCCMASLLKGAGECVWRLRSV